MNKTKEIISRLLLTNIWQIFNNFKGRFVNDVTEVRGRGYGTYFCANMYYNLIVTEGVGGWGQFKVKFV